MARELLREKSLGPHQCNAYCRDGRHATMHYTKDDVTEQDMRDVLPLLAHSKRFGLMLLIDVVPAGEALPLEDYCRVRGHPFHEGMRSCTKAFLVFWQRVPEEEDHD